MGYGETNLKNWSYRSAFLLIVTGVLLISICSMSISYIRNPSTLASHITTAGGIFIFVALVSIVVGCVAIYRTNLLNILYLKVSSEAAERNRNMVGTQKQAVQPVQRPDTLAKQPTSVSPPATVSKQPTSVSPPATVSKQPTSVSPPATVSKQPTHPIVFI